MVEKMIATINESIKWLYDDFHETGKMDRLLKYKIDGMMDMLCVATGDVYMYNFKGVYKVENN